MRRHAFWFGMGSTIVLAACSDAMGPRVDKLREALAQAKVSLRESVLAGEASVTGGGMGVKAELLVASDPEYSVGALGRGNMHDVRVDIVSGAVITSRVLGASADPCPRSISLAAAIGIAEA